ncbi:MAG TPA: ABC transporter substrate-binding protein [Sphingomicrobium sp.]|nr:ABC transporter substrate-binding protein [Sphingomicrobium sp.]
MRMRLLRRSLLVALAAATVTATGGCQSEPEGVVGVVVIDGDPRLVTPGTRPLTSSEAVLIDNVAQGLVSFDARGQIEPGLAETWNVSDDGLSYIFRLANGDWPDGRKITAEQVARMLRKMIAPPDSDRLDDAFGAVEDIVAMTDRVLEIRLKEPRPHLLQLLAQPEMGLVREEQGTGPFTIDRANSRDGTVRLTREVALPDEEQTEREQLNLSGAKAQEAIRAFVSGTADLVLGGTFADLPYVPRDTLSRGALQFDPASGLFGLIPARDGGPMANPEVRQLLSAAIDREAFIAALAVPGLVPRATVLEPGLANIPDPVPPDWATTPTVDRQPALKAAAERLFENEDKTPVIRVALPPGPGSDVLFERLSQDWGGLGIDVKRVGIDETADLRLVDEVAPSAAASWFLRHFRCGAAKICAEQVDEKLDGARNAAILAQRTAFLSEASRQIDSLQLFIPIAAPIRWSLVSQRISGFAGNRFAIHTLTGLERQLNRTGE